MPSFSTMFSTVSAVAVLAGMTSAAPVAKSGSPKTWATGYLEDYEVYHSRYMALNCQTQHNTTFFESCCHPLLAVEDLTTRHANCTPSAVASSSASSIAATATSNATDVDAESEYCEEATSIASYVSSVAASISATATASVSAVVYTTANVTATLAVEDLYKVAAPSTTWSAASSTWTPESSSSAWVAPTSTWVAPTSTWVAPTSTWVAPTSTYVAPVTTTVASTSGGSYSGQATYFYQGGVAGACGTVHSDNDKVIAIDTNGWWQNTGVTSSNCGRWITITNTNNGKSVTAMVADACPSCVSDNSLDLSVGAFTAIASEDDGMVPITWSWA